MTEMAHDTMIQRSVYYEWYCAKWLSYYMAKMAWLANGKAQWVGLEVSHKAKASS